MLLKQNFLNSLVIITAIGLLCALGLIHATPPLPLAATVSPAIFSSSRAIEHLQHIANSAHPTGTPENAMVRNYLLGELKNLGFEPQVQTSIGLNQQGKKSVVGLVNNVLVKIPGRLSGKALLLAAHYDSTPHGPGAADDGASVAAILETLRALKNNPPLQNDLICIFTDGEEAGLLGAEAFSANHPWAKNIGLLLNFEYRGNRGPMLMFETSAGNSKLIDGLAKSVAHPLANSLMYEVYQQMPNDTDLTVFKRAGIAGMNFAAIEGHTSYHTELDRPKLMQEASLQHQGDIMLSLVRYFGNIDLQNLQAPDKVYFDMSGIGMIRYPVVWVMPITGLMLALCCLVLTAGVRSGQLRLVRVLICAPVFLLTVFTLAILCQSLWLLICRIHPQYQLILQGDTYNSHWYLLAFVLLTIGIFSLFQFSVRTWVTAIELIQGVIIIWSSILLALSFIVPGASYLFVWPMLPVLLVIGAHLLYGHKESSSSWPLICFLLSLTPVILIFAPLIKSLFIGLTPQLVGISILFLALTLGLLSPLFYALNRLASIGLPIITGVFFLIVGSLTSGFDSKHPRPNNLFYAVNPEIRKAFWLSSDRYLDTWTQDFFPNRQQKRQVQEIFGEKSTPTYWVSTAPILPLQAPFVNVLSDRVEAGIRTIKFHIQSLRQAPEMRVFVEGLDVISAKVENKIISQELGSAWNFQAIGFSEKGLSIELTVEAKRPFKIKISDVSYQLPKITMKPRPDDMMRQPFGLSDTTIVARNVEFQ